MGESYKRRELHSYILHALQTLGGIASRKEIMIAIANDNGNDIKAQVLETKDPSHSIFNLDFRMGIINLRTCGLIEDYQRNSEITLTDKGIDADYTRFPSKDEQALMDKYWKDHHSTHSNNTEVSTNDQVETISTEKTILTEMQVKLAEQLLISVKKKEPYVTYSELASRVAPPIHHRNVGKNIGQISVLCHELGLPLLSAKVINKNTATAGEGFYPLYQMLGIPTDGKTEKELYNAERKAIRECQEWYRLEDYLGLSIGLPRPESEHKYGDFYSWTILNDNVALKKGDKSFFEHHGSALPKEIKWFFNVDGLKHGEELPVLLHYEEKAFSGRIETDALERSRIFWHSDLSQIFQSHYHAESDYYPVVRFERLNNNEYGIEFVDDEIIDKENPEPLETEVIPQAEGKKKEFYITKYERNPINRKNAIRIHGTKCMICGFDFEAFYGEAGRSVIEVHHVKPLSEVGEEVVINPETDLVCLCSNCHRIIHKKKNGIYSLEEVKEMIKQNGQGV